MVDADFYLGGDCQGGGRLRLGEEVDFGEAFGLQAQVVHIAVHDVFEGVRFGKFFVRAAGGEVFDGGVATAERVRRLKGLK